MFIPFTSRRPGSEKREPDLLEKDIAVNNASGRGLPWPSIAIGGVVAGVLIGAVAFIVLSLVGGDRLGMLISAATVHPHESTAEWVGDDAVVYASLNLRPGLSELLRARDLFEDIADFEQADLELDDAFDELNELLGMDVRESVLPALGPELAIAAYVNESRADRMDFIAFIGFLDMEIGRSMADAILEAAVERGESVEQVTISGIEARLWDQETYIVVHESEPYILVSSAEEVMERTLAMMQAPENPLSTRPEFVAALERLPDNRFLAAYADVSKLRAASTYLGTPRVVTLNTEAIAAEAPTQIISGAITVGRKNLRADYVISIGDETFDAAAPDSNLDLIPADLIGFFNVGGLREAIDDSMESFYGLNPGSQEQTELSFTSTTGLDIKEDILDPIGDELAVVLIDLEGDGTGGFNEDFPRFALAVLLETRDRPKMESTMARLREFAADSELNFTESEVAGETAWIAQLPDDSAPFELAYMFKDDFLVGGISLESLEAVVMTAEGEVESVRSNEAYQRFTEETEEDAVFNLFIEAEPLSTTVRSFVSPEDIPEFDERVMPWFEKFESFGVATTLDGEWAVTTMLMTINN